MFSYISGKIASKQENLVIIDVGGIGYEITVSSSTLLDLSAIYEDVKLYTYFQIKEDGVALYGFLSQLERSMFLKLINVSGVGPKIAITMLSNIKYTDLANAIICNDINLLTNTKGIGKKTAERIILELKEKINPLEFITAGNLNANATANDNNAITEAVNTLTQLGINKLEALRLARDVAKKDSTAEEIILEVFKSSGK
ncbi:MAG: Holliday junction branch migration protein RuvA [Clostridia bacterium]|jgi:Holliday junction DNA helicase RuvA|nr:Holliday junction branch migration protein RuvA [Clostridia bacterium]MDD4275460.1 Holliday junction branch migration protein RuvA [Clostridia bacterium]